MDHYEERPDRLHQVDGLDKHLAVDRDSRVELARMGILAAMVDNPAVLVDTLAVMVDNQAVFVDNLAVMLDSQTVDSQTVGTLAVTVDSPVELVDILAVLVDTQASVGTLVEMDTLDVSGSLVAMSQNLAVVDSPAEEFVLDILNVEDSHSFEPVA